MPIAGCLDTPSSSGNCKHTSPTVFQCILKTRADSRMVEGESGRQMTATRIKACRVYNTVDVMMKGCRVHQTLDNQPQIWRNVRCNQQVAYAPNYWQILNSRWSRLWRTLRPFIMTSTVVYNLLLGFGFRVEGLGYKVQGSEFRAGGLKVGNKCLECGV